MVILLNISKIDLLVSRESNGVLGNYYSISAYDGDTYLEQEIADGIIAAAPDQESAAWAKSAIDTGKIVIISC
jgi:hypothetical protein